MCQPPASTTVLAQAQAAPSLPAAALTQTLEEGAISARPAALPGPTRNCSKLLMRRAGARCSSTPNRGPQKDSAPSASTITSLAAGTDLASDRARLIARSMNGCSDSCSGGVGGEGRGGGRRRGSVRHLQRIF